MKSIILHGGFGTKLRACAKQLIPIANKPSVRYVELHFSSQPSESFWNDFESNATI
jgi:NDP-sugar pyrophosphorylase family protein